MIYKSDVLEAMKADRFDGVAEQPAMVEYMRGLIDIFFQGAEQQDVLTAMTGAAVLRRVADAFLVAIRKADARN